MAEAVGEGDPQPMQRLLYSARWEAEGARDELQRFIVKQSGDESGIGVVDETGFLKKGTKSVGVRRQYSGTAGKIESCQVGVFLSYFNGRNYVFLDRRLYLPEEWFTDWERRRGAHVPDDVAFKTKPQLALEMLKHAWSQGVPRAWVAGDEVYMGIHPTCETALPKLVRSTSWLSRARPWPDESGHPWRSRRRGRWDDRERSCAWQTVLLPHRP